MVEDEGVLHSKLIVGFVIDTVTRILSSARFQTLRKRCDILHKQETNSDIGLILGPSETREADLVVCCRHRVSDDLVLELGRKFVEGEDAINLFMFNGKFPRILYRWRVDKPWIEQLCCLLSSGKGRQQGNCPRHCQRRIDCKPLLCLFLWVSSHRNMPQFGTRYAKP